MASPFEIVILRLKDIGAFEFLFPFMLTAAIFYGLLRRSQIFGTPERNVAVNGVVALVAAFMVWAYPVLVGISIEKQLSQFFFSGVVVLLTVMILLLGSSMVLKEGLGKFFEERYKGGLAVAFIVFGIIIAIGILVSSGLLNIFFPQTVVGGIPQDVILTIIVVVLMAVTVIGIASVGAGGGEKKG
ncbi:MAG: hypothetical protein HY361_02295 [Candidatus Aenigmarchaeota archaeon]|nr:hypothetical protein [Candidatus Aenigmarchaeota archaeon]